MTLLELVVGVTITGMALTAGFGALATLNDRRERLDAAVGADAQAAALRAELAAWVGGARLVAEEGAPNFRGLDGVGRGEGGHMPDDDLTLLTTAATPLGSGEAIVRLYVDRDSTTPERGLTAAFAAWGSAVPRVVRVQLDPRVASLDVRYLSGVLGRRTWLPSWVSSSLLPAGVELRLAPAAPDTLPSLLRLPIVVPLRGGP